jgi:rubrerythrin
MSAGEFEGGGSLFDRTQLQRFRCVACSFGASRPTAPQRCPMCGSSTWEYETWRPFSDLADDPSPTTDRSERFTQ